MEYLLQLLTQFRYFILFPLAIVEGPIITVIAGFLCSLGFLNPLFVFPIIISGDVIGDSIYYGLGRSGNPKFFQKISKWIGINPKKIDPVISFFNANPIRTISLSKIVLGIGVAGLFLAGQAKIPYKKFLLVCLLTSFVQCAVYLCIGLLFGKAYLEINRYLTDFASITIIVTLVSFVFFIIKSKMKKR
jgi:membrane-associated protein